VRLALGTRRNGWLLAPLIAEIVADQLAGAEPAIHAARFAPDRFDQAVRQDDIHHGR
jgi:glycine oxidase